LGRALTSAVTVQLKRLVLKGTCLAEEDAALGACRLSQREVADGKQAKSSLFILRSWNLTLVACTRDERLASQKVIKLGSGNKDQASKPESVLIGIKVLGFCRQRPGWPTCPVDPASLAGKSDRAANNEQVPAMFSPRFSPSLRFLALVSNCRSPSTNPTFLGLPS
jgi:hypothetical protein